MLGRFSFAVIVLVFCCFGYGGVSCNDYENNNIGRGLDAKSVLTSIASNLMSRGYGTSGSGSQALIFAAGSLGAGHLKGGFGRSIDGEEKIVTDEEILMYLSYLTGSAGNNGCLQNIACQQPYQAKKYVNAGDVLLKTAKMFSTNVQDDYEYVLREVDQASNVGIAGGNCQLFRCSNNT